MEAIAAGICAEIVLDHPGPHLYFVTDDGIEQQRPFLTTRPIGLFLAQERSFA